MDYIPFPLFLGPTRLLRALRSSRRFFSKPGVAWGSSSWFRLLRPCVYSTGIDVLAALALGQDGRHNRHLILPCRRFRSLDAARAKSRTLLPRRALGRVSAALRAKNRQPYDGVS